MDFRNDELLRANSISLKEIANETARENKAMLIIARKSKADSRMMKIATLIGTIYLPLSLVTVSFLLC
jgi:Mg2+ and Co2+ transporter CorA